MAEEHSQEQMALGTPSQKSCPVDIQVPAEECAVLIVKMEQQTDRTGWSMDDHNSKVETQSTISSAQMGSTALAKGMSSALTDSNSVAKDIHMESKDADARSLVDGIKEILIVDKRCDNLTELEEELCKLPAKKKRRGKKGGKIDLSQDESNNSDSGQANKENTNQSENEIQMQHKAETFEQQKNNDDVEMGSLLDFGKKKKKRNKIADKTESSEGKLNENLGQEEDEVNEEPMGYTEMLKRLYAQGEAEGTLARNTKLSLPPPCVIRRARVTTFVNFLGYCKAFKRVPKHLMDYMSVELGAICNVTGTNQLNMKGRFTEKNIQTVIKSYINEYVLCTTCKSTSTFLTKSKRLDQVVCNDCMARTSVKPITRGYIARTMFSIRD